MPARASTDVPADSLRAFADMAWETYRSDHPAALGITALRNITLYAPTGKRVRLWIEWETEADRHQDVTEPTEAPFDYQSEEVAEAFTEWCAAKGVEARNDQEYRWLRQAFTAGMNETARYPFDPGPIELPRAGSISPTPTPGWASSETGERLLSPVDPDFVPGFGPVPGSGFDPGPVAPSPWGHPEPSRADDPDEPTNRDIEPEPADWHDGPDPD
jgi:hypothetical protein